MNESQSDIYFDGILPAVQKPSRYIDRELNLAPACFSEGQFNVLLVFPDLYEIGMSHQGIRYLYRRLAGMEGVGAELAFAPWPDLEELLEGSGTTFRSWQTSTPASSFDLIGFSLTYELHYTNMLMIIERTGLALRAEERPPEAPLVVTGGPCCTNPTPFIEAVDAVFLGDAEESLMDAVRMLGPMKKAGAGRAGMREALGGIEGVYVDGVTPEARTRVYRLGDGDLAREPIVPAASIVHDRLTAEIVRGCTRGCRFCHAGIFYRPRRERSVDEIVASICAGLDATGWDEVSLLSLSSSDYSHLDELLERLSPELGRRRVSLALPSLRPEAVTDRMISASGLVRKSGFTLAPEAGTERLRCVINKGMSEEAILDGCRRILEAGWQTLKLYFMIGLPTETDEDLDGIVDLVHAILGMRRGGGRFRLGVSISPFVPKPHTPFQWERQCSIEELKAKEDYLAARLRSRRIQLGLRAPELSTLEGIFARGDRRLWPVLVGAYRRGCRFDGWRDRLRFDLWSESIEENGLDLEDLLGPFPLEGPLPWKATRPRVSPRYLAAERDRALSGELTPDCRVAGCRGCGACDRAERKEAVPAPEEVRDGGMKTPVRNGGGTDAGAEAAGERLFFRYRCIYEKIGRVRFLSHIETCNILQRALRRTGLPINYTKGFHPHPRLSYGPSLGVGMEGCREFFDVELTAPGDVTPAIFSGFLPEGMRITASAGPFGRSAGKVPERLRLTYRLAFDAVSEIQGADGDDTEHLSKRNVLWYLLAKRLLRDHRRSPDPHPCGEDPAIRFRRGVGRLIEDGVPIVDGRGNMRSVGGCRLETSADPETIVLVIETGDGPVARPGDLVGAVFPAPLTGLVKVRRLGIELMKDGRYVDALDAVTSGRS